MTKPLAIVFCAFALASCKPTDRPENTLAPVRPSNRFTVEIVGTFNDDLAYASYRSIYLVRDAKTGAEFVGISGVGISEIGKHGRSGTEDER